MPRNKTKNPITGREGNKKNITSETNWLQTFGEGDQVRKTTTVNFTERHLVRESVKSGNSAKGLDETSISFSCTACAVLP